MTSSVRTHVPKTGRELEEILILHDLTVEQFAGKTVLDIGCGYSDLEADLRARGVGARVIGLDIGMRQLAHRKPSAQPRRSVMADISAPLPVRTESVDMVLATYSYPMWATSADRITTFYREVGRVTKLNGLVSIYPNCASHIGADEDYESDQIASAMAAATRQGYRAFASEGWSFQSEYPDLLQSLKVSSEV